MNDEILEKTCSILKDHNNDYISDGYVKIQKENNEWILILYGAMYHTPEVNFACLKALSEYYKTDKISLNLISSSGCETCDFGSDYCNEIRIKQSPLFDQINWEKYLEKTL